MPWSVLFAAEFRAEVAAMAEDVREALLANARALGEIGPQMGRPRADTLDGSKFANMKELRFKTSTQVWRAAFAFDPKQQAIILVAGDKQGESQRGFYKWLIDTADKRYAAHLARLKKEEDERKQAEAKSAKKK